MPIHFNDRELLPKFFHIHIQSSKQCITFRITIFLLSYIQRNTLKHFKFNPISVASLIVYAYILKLQISYDHDFSLNIITFIKIVICHVLISKWLESTSFRNTSSYSTVVFRSNHTELIETSFRYLPHFETNVKQRTKTITIYESELSERFLPSSCFRNNNILLKLCPEIQGTMTTEMVPWRK